MRGICEVDFTHASQNERTLNLETIRCERRHNASSPFFTFFLVVPSLVVLAAFFPQYLSILDWMSWAPESLLTWKYFHATSGSNRQIALIWLAGRVIIRLITYNEACDDCSIFQNVYFNFGSFLSFFGKETIYILNKILLHSYFIQDDMWFDDWAKTLNSNRNYNYNVFFENQIV